MGISLGDLVEGASFESNNGKLEFTDFELIELEGSALRNLDFYRLFPLDDGFKLAAPMAAFHGSQATLELSYDVTVTDEAPLGFGIEFMSMSILGIAVGSESLMEATAQLSSGDELNVEAYAPFGHSQTHDSVSLAHPLETLSIDEVIALTSGKHNGHRFGGFAAGTAVTHHFPKLQLAPEPATALMLGSGLFCLVALGRRQRLGQGLRR